MLYLVTGGLGYLGGRLLEYLVCEGHNVKVTTRRPPESWPGWAGKYNPYQIDINSNSNWRKALEDIDFVFHLAAPDAESAALDPISALRAGGEMTWTLLDAVSDAKKKIPVINVSTFHIYGPHPEGLITESSPLRPVHPYAISHLFSEIVTQSFWERRGLSILNVRLSNAFGRPIAIDAAKWSLVFNDLCMQAATSDRLRLKSSGLQKRNFITLGDTVRAIAFLSFNYKDWPDDHIMHVGSAVHWSIRDVAEHIAERSNFLWGKRLEITFPEIGENQIPKDFTFDVSRLERTGFVWENKFEQEIDNTLIACRKWEKSV